MEIRQLQYALQIAQEKSFSRAAEKLLIAQPSLSQQLAKLEKELGVRLFQRTTSSVEPTYAGQVFVERAQSILDQLDQLQQEMEDLSSMHRGKIVVGSLPITGSHIWPQVLPAFNKAYPNIEISLVEDTTARLEELTALGKTDISLLTYPISNSALSAEPILREAITLAVPANHPFAKRSSVSIRELQDEAFITLKRGQGFRDMTFDLCKDAGFVPHIAFESSNIETVQSLVAAEMGIAFVPEMTARAKWSHYVPVYVPIEENPSRTVVIGYRKDRYLSKAAAAFIETIKKVVHAQ
jgi:DNA-binding transcriptional LysR family regulator